MTPASTASATAMAAPAAPLSRMAASSTVAPVGTTYAHSARSAATLTATALPSRASANSSSERLRNQICGSKRHRKPTSRVARMRATRALPPMVDASSRGRVRPSSSSVSRCSCVMRSPARTIVSPCSTLTITSLTALRAACRAASVCSSDAS